MTSKIGLHSFGDLSVTAQDFFTNHQKWQIGRHLNHEMTSFIFHLKDSHGAFHIATEFILENLDPTFIEALKQLDSAEKQQTLIHEYLQHRLDQATPHQVHIELYDHKLFVRLGDHGLKGGVKIWGVETGKTGAFLASTAQVGGGICFVLGGGPLVAGALISSGLSSGLYAYQSDKNGRKYSDKEYAKQVVSGFLSGGISSAFGPLAEGAGRVAKIGWGMLGSVAGNVSSVAATELMEKGKEGKSKNVGRKIFDSAVVGAIGAGIGGAAGSLINGALAGEVSEEIGERVTKTFIAKRALESGLRSGSSKLATGAYESMREEESAKKKDLRTLGMEALQSGFIGAALGGAIAYADQSQKIREYNRIKKQIEQTERELEEAQVQKAESESSLQELRKNLEDSEQNLIKKKETQEQQEQNLEEKKAQQQKIEEQIGIDQQEIDEAKEITAVAEQELHIANQALEEAKERISKQQQAINEAKQTAAASEKHLERAKQRAQGMQQFHSQIVDGVNKDIQSHLEQGFKAKIGDHYTKDEDEIREAYLQGVTVIWKKGKNVLFGSREKVRMTVPPLEEEYQKAQTYVEETEQKMQDFKSYVDQKQAELKRAEDVYDLQSQSVDQTQAKLEAAQKVLLKQSELKDAQDQLKAIQQESQQAQLEMENLEREIQADKEQADRIKTQYEEESERSQEISSRETGLEKLSQEQQEALRKISRKETGKTFSHSVNESALKKALQAESVSYVDCKLEELISHVVLVHALHHPPVSMALKILEKIARDEGKTGRKMTEEEQIRKSLIYHIQEVVTPNGSIGSHLRVEDREFNGELLSRPHLHWSWNQLVQQNGNLKPDGTGVNNWEEAKVAFLEPLSTIEERIYYKSFGVAPYDTLTFNEHRFSEKSTLLVPASIAMEIRAHLPKFQGKIVSYGDGMSLRKAVMEGLKRYDPWHICNEKGELIGGEAKHSGTGYNPHTFIRKKEGEIIQLISNSGLKKTDRKAEAIQEWGKERFIGLHANSVTFWIEDGNNRYFKALEIVKKDHTRIKDNPLFAGYVEDIRGLGILQALKFYQELSRYDVKTGAMEIASYILNEAIYADLMSLFYKKNPEASFNLSILDLKMIFDASQHDFLDSLKKIKEYIKENDSQKITDSFSSYCSSLNKSLADIWKAKKQIDQIRKPNLQVREFGLRRYSHLCLSVAQAEWEEIKTPNSIEFDLGKEWPLNNQLKEYAYKILCILPVDCEELQQLYQELFSYSNQEVRNSEEKKKQYRLNIIRNIIQWALQEKFYLESIKKNDTVSPILVNKLSKQRQWLTKCGLETRNFTKNIGDCLFDNIIDQFPGTSSNKPTSFDLRQELIQHMRSHSEFYAQPGSGNLRFKDERESQPFRNWEEYLTLMEYPQMWATEREIRALAFHLRHPIVLLTIDMSSKIYNSNSERLPFFLYDRKENHFEACVPKWEMEIRDIYDWIKKQKNTIVFPNPYER